MAEQQEKKIVHEFRAVARGVRMSARKARLVMDMVRGWNAHEAMTLLKFVNKRAAPEVGKLIQSAVANAEEYSSQKNVPVATEELVVFDLRADLGPQMKRWRPRSRGMANPFTRYTCHLTATVAEAKYLEERARSGRPSFARPRQRLSKEQRLAKRNGGVAVETKAAPAKAEPAAAPAKEAARAAKAEKPAKAGAEKGNKGAKAEPKAESKKKPGKK